MAKRFFNWWLHFGYWLLLRLSVEGVENVPLQGPVILMINHINFLDPFVVVASMPRQVTAMSKIENFSIPFWGLVFRLYGAIPVQRGQVDRKALKQALDVLKSDTMLLIAPEGTRSRDGTLQPAHNGLAFIAHRSKAVIVPVAITGSPGFSHHVKRLRRTPVHIKLGKPFYLHTDARRLERQAMTDMTNEAMYQLAALLPPDHRGVYNNLEQATEHYIQFLDEGVTNLPSPSSREARAALQPSRPNPPERSEGDKSA